MSDTPIYTYTGEVDILNLIFKIHILVMSLTKQVTKTQTIGS